jgi:hypothetical protein
MRPIMPGCADLFARFFTKGALAMRRFAISALAVVFLLGITVFAGQGDTKKAPVGTWTRTKDDTTVKFEIKSDMVRCIIDGPLGKLDVEADYGMSHDGKAVFGRIRKVKEGTGVDKGDLFGFGYELKGDILTISDWKGTGGAGFGFVLQGEYKKSDSK